jgi:hypothetical protein
MGIMGVVCRAANSGRMVLLGNSTAGPRKYGGYSFHGQSSKVMFHLPSDYNRIIISSLSNVRII